MRCLLMLCLLAALPAAHALDMPPIRPGLWESMPGPMMLDGKPTPSPAQMSAHLDKLPPQMRAQVEQQMRAQGVEMGVGGSVRHCISAEMLKRQQWGQGQNGCQVSGTERSGSTWRWKGQCTQPPGSMEGSTTLQGDAAYRSEVKVKTERNGKEHVMTTTVEARWVAADCGAVKPMATP